MDNSETINMKLWRHAAPLSQADIAYAPKRLKEMWEEASNISVLDTMQNEMEAANEKPETNLEFVGSVLQSAQPIFKYRSAVLEKAREILRNYVDNGKLLTFAFEAPRTLRSDPVELSPDYWRGTVTWNSSELRIQSLKFVEVRILHPETAKRLRAEELPAPAKAPSTGRPTVQPQITEAFTILLQAEIIDLGSSMKTAFPPIQEWIKTHRPEALGDKDALSNETIRRTIAPLFKEAKRTHSKKQ